MSRSRVGEPADPPPAIISILYRFSVFDRLPENVRVELLRYVDKILSAWDANENIGQLIDFLGILQKQGGRRLVKTCARELALAQSVLAYVEAGKKPAAAKELTASQYSADLREVERAYAGWRFFLSPKTGGMC